MFAEDVELSGPKGAFLGLLQTHRDDPATLQQRCASWADMDRGDPRRAGRGLVLHFNGKPFKGAGEDGYSLLLNARAGRFAHRRRPMQLARR